MRSLPRYSPEALRDRFLGHQFDMGIQVEPGHVMIGRHPLRYSGNADFLSAATGHNDIGFAPEGQADDLTFTIPHGESGYSTHVVLNRASHDHDWGPKGMHYSLSTTVPTLHNRNALNWPELRFAPHENVHMAPYQGPEHLLDTLMSRSSRIDSQVKSGELPSYRGSLSGIRNAIAAEAESAAITHPHDDLRQRHARLQIYDVDRALRRSERFDRREPEDSVHGGWTTLHGLPKGAVFFSNGKFNPFKSWEYEPETVLRNGD